MSERPPADRRVAQIMRQQWGLVTARQAAAAGMSETMLKRRLDAGVLRKVGRGVYAAAGMPQVWEQQALAACLAGGAGAVLSHRSAARAWCLDLPAGSAIEVTVPFGHSGRPPAPGVRLHRARSLPGADRTRLGALPVTTVARTLVDLARALDRQALAVLVEGAVARRLVRPDRVARTLERARPGPGTATLRSVLAPFLDGMEVDSVAEATVLRAIAAIGLPPPRTQHQVTTPEGARYRLDLAWPERMVALEVDGYRWHAGPTAHAQDSHRANVLAALGWCVLRVTPRELERSPAAVVEALRRRLLG